MTIFRAASSAALCLFLACAGALAQDVTLTSRDGAVEVTGTLLGFDGEFYRVDTEFGELTVDGSGVLCDGPGCPNLSAFVADVYFSGASSMAEVLLPALVEGFARSNGLVATRTAVNARHYSIQLSSDADQLPAGRFHVHVANTDEGFADLLANESDIVLALREIRPDERRRAYERSMGDMTAPNRSLVVALDAIVPVVSPGNPIRTISTPDLARLFGGEITNWQELGGPDAPVALHLPDRGSGLTQAVEDRLLAPVSLALADGVRFHKVSSDLSESVARDPFAIGIAGFAEAQGVQSLTLTGACGFSLAANRRAIKTEDYPLNSPMFFYTPARRLPKIARDFLTYARGPSAQIVIRRAGYVDQEPELISLNEQGDRFANAISTAGEETTLDQLQSMVTALSPMERLTTSFRFETGSSRLDAQSRTNVQQLARDIDAGKYDARRLVFVGFSDGQGAASGNLSIARKRAKAVHKAVIETANPLEDGRVNMEVIAFGEAMPMACDDSAWGRQVNRRVEIWVQ